MILDHAEFIINLLYPSIDNYLLLIISTRPYFQKRIFNEAANEEPGSTRTNS